MVNFLTSVLYVTWDVSPDIFSIGSLHIRWYSLLFVGSFIFGGWLFAKFYKREGLPQQMVDTIFFVGLLSALIGARLGHVIFYDLESYLAEPSEIIKVWHGGLASHGGAIGLLLGIWWYVRKYGKKYNIDFLWIGDRIAIAVAFAGMAIRLGNLMNSEIYGYETTLPWGFIFVRDGQTVPHHPTQIYEALAYLAIGLMLLPLYFSKLSKKIYRGFIFGLFLVLLFGARFMIEFLKMPQDGNDAMAAQSGRLLNNGQLLSIPFIVAGVIILIWSFVAKKPLLRKPSPTD